MTIGWSLGKLFKITKSMYAVNEDIQAWAWVIKVSGQTVQKKKRLIASRRCKSGGGGGLEPVEWAQGSLRLLPGASTREQEQIDKREEMLIGIDC